VVLKLTLNISSNATSTFF